MLTMMERIRNGVRPIAPVSGKKGLSPGTDPSAGSPGMMHSHYQEEPSQQTLHRPGFVDQTPPATGI